MHRVYSVSRGHAALPASVLQLADSKMIDWRGSGVPVMEVSHHDKHDRASFDEIEAQLRRQMTALTGYRMLFKQGGAIRGKRRRTDESGVRSCQRVAWTPTKGAGVRPP
jgi:phosphoserine aminotransferase